ncbi:MAG TPA: cell division protein FtsQ/DivIB [Thermoleophilaceae bacterium]|nr:cell division protein FtsQ/DivIB [Thermoleophilaceae bacterium]
MRPALARAAGAAVVATQRLGPVVLALPHPGKRTRRWLVIGSVLALVLGAAYRLWVRDSPFVSVDRVTVTGLSTKDAKRVRAALVSTARTMTTLHVERDRLERVVAGYPVVRALEIETDFPHGLAIRVVEHEPAALAATGGDRVPVAADGTVLEGLPVEGRLPVIRTDGEIEGARLADDAALGAARVAGAAPTPLLRRVEEIERDGRRGYVAQLRDGPELVFGAAAQLRSKWSAAARVLADAETQGATYVDLRVPGRPAVGGLPAVSTVPAEPLAPTTPLVPGVDPATAEAPPEGTVPPADPLTTDAPAGVQPPATAAPDAGAAPPGTPAVPTAEAGGGAAAAPVP